MLVKNNILVKLVKTLSRSCVKLVRCDIDICPQSNALDVDKVVHWHDIVFEKVMGSKSCWNFKIIYNLPSISHWLFFPTVTDCFFQFLRSNFDHSDWENGINIGMQIGLYFIGSFCICEEGL